MVNPLPVGLALSKMADEMAKHAPKSVVCSFIRPANTTAYASGDIIYPAVPAGLLVQVKALQFKDALPLGSSGFVVEAQLKLFSAQGTKLSADLHLFSAPLTVAPVDNDPFAVGTNVSQADAMNHVTTISFPDSAAESLGGFTMYQVAPNKVVTTNSSSTSLYGILVAKNAYVPIASEKVVVQLSIVPRIVIP